MRVSRIFRDLAPLEIALWDRDILSSALVSATRSRSGATRWLGDGQPLPVLGLLFGDQTDVDKLMPAKRGAVATYRDPAPGVFNFDPRVAAVRSGPQGHKPRPGMSGARV